MNLLTLISNRKKRLQQSHPKSRDKERHKLRVLEVVKQIKREIKAA